MHPQADRPDSGRELEMLFNGMRRVRQRPISHRLRGAQDAGELNCRGVKLVSLFSAEMRTAADAATSASRACCAASSTLLGSFSGMSQSMVPPSDSADISESSLSDRSSAVSAESHVSLCAWTLTLTDTLILN